MKQFIGFKGTATMVYGSKTGTPTVTDATSPELLAEGCVGLYAKSGTTGKLILVDAVADFLDTKSFVVCRGGANGAFQTSDVIERNSLSVEKFAAVAAVAQITTLAFPTNLAAGTLVVVQVVNSSSPIMSEWTSKNYEYTTLAASESSATIGAAVLAKVTADSAAIVTVSGLTLINKTAGKKFSVSIQNAEGNALPGATATVTTVPVKAEGYLAGVQALELECHGYAGGTRRGDGRLGDIAAYSTIDTAAASYVMYNLTWNGTTNRLGVATDAKASRFKRLYLAIPTASAQITLLDTILVGAAQEEVAAQAEESGV